MASGFVLNGGLARRSGERAVLLNPDALFTELKWWRRGWDSDHCWLLKTKNLTEFRFFTIRQIRTKALVETRLEHVALGLGTMKQPAADFFHPSTSQWRLLQRSIGSRKFVVDLPANRRGPGWKRRAG